MFTSPLFLLGSAVATVWAAIFHLIFGRRLVDLVLYWFVGLVGLAVGQAMGDILELRWLVVGQLHMFEATLACWIAMLIARWLRV